MKIGVMELIVIFIVALLVIGPDKLPSVKSLTATTSSPFLLRLGNFLVRCCNTTFITSHPSRSK